MSASNNPRVHSADTARFLDAARSMVVKAPEIVPVWPFLIQAMEAHWLGPANIDHAIDTTRLRIGFGVEELIFDFDPPGADPLIVLFVSDEFRVPTDAMVVELERLRRRYRCEPEPEGSDSSSTSSKEGSVTSSSGQSSGASTTSPGSTASAATSQPGDLIHSDPANDMPAPSPAEVTRFVALGRSQQIANRDVADCWYYVIEAFQNRWFGQEHLDRIIDDLRRRKDLGAEEIGIEFDPPGGDTMVVTFISDEYRCPADALIAELERLRRRHRGEPELGGSGSSGAPSKEGSGTSSSGQSSRASTTSPGSTASAATSQSGEAPDLLAILDGFLKGIPDALQADPALRARVDAVRSTIGRVASAAQSTDPATRQRAVDEAAALQAELARASEATANHTFANRAGLLRALDAAGALDPARLAQGLRTITDWLEQRPGAGAQVDQLIATLENTVGRVLVPGARADDAKRDERIRADARSSIAERLRQHGIKPSGDS